MDPVDNSFMFDKLRGKPLKLKNIEKLLFLNAARSYEWNLSPTEFSAPFIPSFEIKPENLQLKKGEQQTIEASAFGHSDVLDKTWADIMHNTISKGSEDRDENVLNEYKLWLGTIIGWDKPIIELGVTPFLLAEIFKVALITITAKKILKLRNFI